MAEIAVAITDLDFKIYSNNATAIKEHAVWISAFRVFKIASTIENAYSAEDYNKMIESYPTLVEEFIQLKRHSAQVQKQLLEGESPKLSKTFETPTATNYHLKYSLLDNYYYCLHMK